MTELFSADQRAVFRAIAAQASRQGIQAYVVGGVVRDLFLGHRPLDSDIDFLIGGNALDFADAFVRDSGGTLKRFESFFTAKIISPSSFPGVQEIDLASARTETYPRPGALPSVALASIEADLRRRDFSVNAMALPVELLLPQQAALESLRAGVLDYFNGLHDLSAGQVRVLHEASFIDDPTRIFRAARYALRLGGQVEPQTAGLIGKAVSGSLLGYISEQRKLNELKKVLLERNPLEVLRLLDSWRVLEGVQALQGINDQMLARWSLYQDMAAYAKEEERFDVFTALCAALRAPATHSEALRGFGLSRKAGDQFKVLSQAREAGAIEPGAVEKFSDASLLAAHLCGLQGPVSGELRRRGLPV